MASGSTTASAETYSITVFHGSLKRMLLKGGATLAPTFVDQTVVFDVTLDKKTNKLISGSRIAHTRILLDVANYLNNEIAPKLATEYGHTGFVSMASGMLQVAASKMPSIVQNAVQKDGAAKTVYKKAKIETAIQVVKCTFSLTSAALGLASAVPTFGATSVPAVFGAWSAVSDTVSFLIKTWQSVEDAEKALLIQAKKLNDTYRPDLVDRGVASNMVKAGARLANPGMPTPTPPTSRDTNIRLAGAHLRSAADSVAKFLKVDALTSPFGHTVGPSMSGYKDALKNYENKLADLYIKAMKLTDILYDLLEINEQIGGSGDAKDKKKFEANVRVIKQLLGDSSAGEARTWSDLIKKPVSIYWLVDYYNIGSNTVAGIRAEMDKLVQGTSVNKLDAQQKGIAMAGGAGMWLVGNAGGLATGTGSGFVDKTFKTQGNFNAQKFTGVAEKLLGWRKEADDLRKSLARDYPSDAKSGLAAEWKMDFLKEDEATSASALTQAKGAVDRTVAFRKKYRDTITKLRGLANDASGIAVSAVGLAAPKSS